MSRSEAPRDQAARPIARILTAVLIFQLGIGALLVLGDVQRGGLALPRIGSDTPRLSEPIRPGDQRRRFAPGATAPPPRRCATPATCQKGWC